MNPKLKLVLLYSLFAAIATVANLGSQFIVTLVYHGQFAIALSIAVGTIVGLPIKYFLDKRYIFAYRTRNLAHDGQLFILYGLMAVVTTAIFWGVEWLFEVVFADDVMRLLGGAIGLILGYVIKYRLDKKFVFAS